MFVIHACMTLNYVIIHLSVWFLVAVNTPTHYVIHQHSYHKIITTHFTTNLTPTHQTSTKKETGRPGIDPGAWSRQLHVLPLTPTALQCATTFGCFTFNHQTLSIVSWFIGRPDQDSFCQFWCSMTTSLQPHHFLSSNGPCWSLWGEQHYKYQQQHSHHHNSPVPVQTCVHEFTFATQQQGFGPLVSVVTHEAVYFKLRDRYPGGPFLLVSSCTLIHMAPHCASSHSSRIVLCIRGLLRMCWIQCSVAVWKRAEELGVVAHVVHW